MTGPVSRETTSKESDFPVQFFTVYRIGEGKKCYRCNASAYWVVQDDKYKAMACSAHLGSTIVQGSRRGIWGEPIEGGSR